MSRWFRFHAEALNDPKVQRLDGETFKVWVNLLCLASANDGKLPPVTDIAFALRMTEDGARTVLERLLNATLIDKLSGGADGWHYAPHGWAERQYKSDTSTDRVKRFRERSKPVTVTPPDTEADTDTEEPPLAPKGATKAYAFVGKVCRLNRRDYDSFHGQFFAIPDFNAELAAFDGWASAQSEAKQAKWFGSLAPWLNKRHQEALAAKAPARTVRVGV